MTLFKISIRITELAEGDAKLYGRVGSLLDALRTPAFIPIRL